MHADTPPLRWTDHEGQPQHVRWVSLAGHPPPSSVEVVDDRLDADTAWRLASAGTGLLWCGDFHNARQLLQALARRLERAPARRDRPARRVTRPASARGADGPPAPAAMREAFAAQRRAQAERAQVLGRLLLPFEADGRVPLRRAPDVRAAVHESFGAVGEPFAASLRELQGAIGAHEWRKKGVPIAALGGAHIHPHHGVFSPVRGEYVDLVAQAPLPLAAHTHGAFEVGTGTGVLAAVLARRRVAPIVATDLDERALACADENLRRLGLARAVRLERADLFPEGRAGLVVCNPPWVPAQPSSPLEAAVYDPDSRMLRGFLAGLAAHLARGGEGWLILSDLAEHLGLRRRDELLGWIEAAGLEVLGRLDARPAHRRAADASDPLHAARAAEVTSLWRLGARG